MKYCNFGYNVAIVFIKISLFILSYRWHYIAVITGRYFLECIKLFSKSHVGKEKVSPLVVSAASHGNLLPSPCRTEVIVR